jgi:dihydrofolate reductase
MSKLCLIAAMSKNGCIGVNNQLPWRLPRDLQHFRSLTMGRCVIMGHKTHQSIGRALPGRVNVVISSMQDVSSASIVRVNTVERALGVARSVAAKTGLFFVIGGGQIYRQTIDQADELYITLVDKHVDGDTHFPSIDETIWKAETLDSYYDEHEKCDVHFLRYTRR